MHQYSPEVLLRLQKTETGILACLDRICQSHNLHYFVIFGTAIGAVRHKGFIPWDDDTDVGMLREDYEKLRALGDSVWEEAGGEYYFCRSIRYGPVS